MQIPIFGGVVNLTRKQLEDYSLQITGNLVAGATLVWLDQLTGQWDITNSTNGPISVKYPYQPTPVTIAQGAEITLIGNGRTLAAAASSGGGSPGGSAGQVQFNNGSGGFSGLAIQAAQKAIGVNYAQTINGLGDSITAQGDYQPTNLDLSHIQTWQQNTAYGLGEGVVNNGVLFYASVAGTSAATGTGPTAGFNVADGTVTWQYQPPRASKPSTAYLFHAEQYSGGRLIWNLSDGYAGPHWGASKVIVTNGGQNYTNPTLSFTSGAKGIVNTSGGVITSITITSPGYNIGGGIQFAGAGVSDPTGSGFQGTVVCSPSGTFGCAQCQTIDMVRRLPDVVASGVDIIVVHGGTNDLAANVSFAAITANLKQCYETLMAAGIKVIGVPILPRINLTAAQTLVQIRVNHWIRAYCKGEAWANPSKYTAIALADPTGYFTDGTSATNQPVGGNGGVAGAMTQDGLHPSLRGADYFGYEVWLAAQRWAGAAPNYAARPYSSNDGYDPVVNPGGNCLEAPGWLSSTAYVVGQLVQNGSNIYSCITAGTSAASGGPTGTGANITDGSVHWQYSFPARMSVFASGTAGTSNGQGATISGQIASGYYLQHNQAINSGTVICSIESPWSNGQIGQRQVLNFSLGGASASDSWGFFVANGLIISKFGFTPADLGVAMIFAECEVEISSVQNFNGFNFTGPQDGTILVSSATAGSNAGGHIVANSGEMMPVAATRTYRLKTPPMIMPSNQATISPIFSMAWDASGAAGSATAIVKLNRFFIGRANVA